jgi:hypothetical protein
MALISVIMVGVEKFLIMLDRFRKCYPHGSLISELVQIDHGKYIVRASIQVEGIILATGLAAADTVEEAEDRARERAIALLDLDKIAIATLPQKTIEPQEIEKSQTTKSEKSQTIISSSFELEREKRIESLLAQNKVEPTESLPLQSNGVTPTQTVDVLTPQSPPINSTEEPIPPPEPEKLDLSGDRTATDPTSQLPLETPPALSITSETTTEDASFEDFLARTNVHLKRLNWTNEQGRNYLLQTYGKRSRHLLTDEELKDFLDYLESQP